MNGADLKIWRQHNGYKSQSALQMELELGSRATVSAWENSTEELPRILQLALIALEKNPEARNVHGSRKTGATHVNLRRSDTK